MVICRTPLRISFFGGGTDYPTWYLEHGGCVISSTINKYSYITARWLPPFFDYKHRVRYFQKEETKTIDEIQHPSVRECARFLKVASGMDIVHNADLPARSGLGSSSTFTVGMLHALQALQNRMVTKRELALQAIHVEQELINEAVGSQDQTAAAFGGLNRISFNRQNEIDVDPIVISRDKLDQLQDNLLLVFTGFARTAAEVAEAQITVTPKKSKELLIMKDLCDQALDYLLNTNNSFDDFGRLLNEQWQLKRSLTDRISNSTIDHIYDAGIKNGAVGGKLLGAGGGGFMLFYARKEHHANIKAALNNKLFVPFRFESTGSKIIYFSNE